MPKIPEASVIPEIGPRPSKDNFMMAAAMMHQQGRLFDQGAESLRSNMLKPYQQQLQMEEATDIARQVRMRQK